MQNYPWGSYRPVALWKRMWLFKNADLRHKLFFFFIIVFYLYLIYWFHAVFMMWNIFLASVYTEFATPEKNLTTVDILFTTKAGVGWVAASAYITGWPIFIILITIVICSLPFVRRSGHFQVSHFLSSCEGSVCRFWLLYTNMTISN